MDDIENDRSLRNSGRSTPVHRERKLAEPSTTAQPPTTDPSRTLRLFEQQSVDRRRRALGETVRDASVDRARATGERARATRTRRRFERFRRNRFSSEVFPLGTRDETRGTLASWSSAETDDARSRAR